jgi:pyruvate/2-oxoglutarate/acetoin dehydrogenase E1 component
VNQSAKYRYMSGGQLSVPMVVRTQAGAAGGAAAQHSQSLEAWFVHVPGLVVVMPSTPYDAKGLMKSAIRDDNPVVFLEKRMLYARPGPVPEDEYLVPIGKADIKRQGNDVTVVATGYGVTISMQAARKAAQQGISAEIIDPRTLKPLDIDTIAESVRRTGRLVVVNEGARAAGFASEVVSRVLDEAFGALTVAPIRVTAKDVPGPFAAQLEREVLPTPDDVFLALESVMREQPSPHHEGRRPVG